jgi:hypothetical protein
VTVPQNDPEATLGHPVRIHRARGATLSPIRIAGARKATGASARCRTPTPTGRHTGHRVPNIGDQDRAWRGKSGGLAAAGSRDNKPEWGHLTNAVSRRQQRRSLAPGSGFAGVEAVGRVMTGKRIPRCCADIRQVARLTMAALTLSGCAHKSLIQEKTDEFVGQPLSAVTARLGAPTEEREVRSAKMYIWSGAAGPESTQGKCTIRATMNDEVIGSFDWEGTESQCANYALMLKGSYCRRGMMDARIWVPPCLR